MVRAKLGQHDALFGLCGPVASRLSLASLAVAAVAAGAAVAESLVIAAHGVTVPAALVLPGGGAQRGGACLPEGSDRGPAAGAILGRLPALLHHTLPLHPVLLALNPAVLPNTVR